MVGVGQEGRGLYSTISTCGIGTVSPPSDVTPVDVDSGKASQMPVVPHAAAAVAPLPHGGPYTGTSPLVLTCEDPLGEGRTQALDPGALREI